MFNDLRTLHNKNGAWDIVVFSGDLTQRATEEDFRKLNEVLVELWAVFKDLGFDPGLFCVPGNHDLVRPPQFQAEVMVLEEWWQKSDEFHAAFWKADSAYLKSVNSNFDNYSSWLENLGSLNIRNLSSTLGTIAGDSTGVFEKDGLKLGLVGLNSTWLQLGSRKYEGDLHIDVNQILSITEQDPQGWCEKNDFNLIVTHHPLDWLKKTSKSNFLELIAPDGRFTCHLFGHMHEPNYRAISTGGSSARREIQAASLFGLEKIESVGIERLHGYSLNRISVDTEATLLSYWPRKDRLVAGNRRVIGPDPYFEFELVTTPLEGKKTPSPTQLFVQPSQLIKLDELAAASEGVLDSFRMKIQPAPEHNEVRRVESDFVLDALEKCRCTWITSEWGMGEDGFLWALKEKYEEGKLQYFSIEMGEFRNLISFQDDIKADTGFPLETLCSALELIPESVLILDDVPIDKKWELPQTEEIIKLVKIFLDFAPYLKIIIRSRVSPQNSPYPQVELKPLDQGDTRSYILSHNDGGPKYSSYDTVERIYRNTDGVPSIIDSTLKSLVVTGISGLSAISSDIAGKDAISSTGNEALRKMILGIGDSPDPALQRSHDLLKALTIFPQGEQFKRIKYFNNKKPFYPSNVLELMSRGLVSTLEVEGLGTNVADVENTIMVNRLARETIIEMMTPLQFKELNQIAAKLYFGENIAQAGFKYPRSLRFDKPGRSNPEIYNAAVIIQRLAIDAAASEDEIKINHVVALIAFHAKSLKSGNYFKAQSDFFQDIFPILSECITDRQHAYLTSLFVGSLRMLDGDHYAEQARDLILAIPLELLDKTDRSRCELNLALCHHQLGSASEAKESAERVIKMDPRSNFSIQARWILLQYQHDDPDIDKKTSELLKTAIRRKSNIVAASMTLEKAAKTTDRTKQRAMYEKIVTESTANGDTFTAIKAIVAAGQISKLDYTTQDKSRLIQAYHYLYKASFINLFNSCHQVLWNIFENERDLKNLLQLFKYSSLVWRLRGKESNERDAVKRLQAYTTSQTVAIETSSQTMAYYLFRSTST